MEAKGQPLRMNSLLPFFGFWGLNSECQSCIESTFPCEATLLAPYDISWKLCKSNMARKNRATNRKLKSHVICRWYGPVLKSPQDSTTRLLALTNTFRNRAVSQHTNITTLSTQNWQIHWARKRSANLFTMPSSIKCVVINPTERVKGFYSENWKTWKKELEEDTRRWEDLPCSWFSRLYTVKMAILLEDTHLFNISHQNSTDVPSELGKTTLEICYGSTKVLHK